MGTQRGCAPPQLFHVWEATRRSSPDKRTSLNMWMQRVIGVPLWIWGAPLSASQSSTGCHYREAYLAQAPQQWVLNVRLRKWPMYRPDASVSPCLMSVHDADNGKGALSANSKFQS